MKLATVQKITKIESIPNSDNIEVATVLGWKVVVKKGDFKVGDLAIYCELDSWIPHGIAPFLSKGQEPKEYKGIKGNRLKTVKLRGQISQGLLLPLIYIKSISTEMITEGLDVTDKLKIIKWEKPIDLSMRGIIKGNFPSHIQKTDEVMIQSAPELLDRIKDNIVYITEKLDGTSATFLLQDDYFGICSRNLEIQEGDNVYWFVEKEQKIKDILIELRKLYNANLVIQGEIIGPKIQKNLYELSKPQLFIFNIYIYNINEAKYITHEVLEGNGKELVEKYFVPLIYKGRPNLSLNELLEFAKGKSMVNNRINREGIVVSNFNRTVSFKVLNNDYLLKDDL